MNAHILLFAASLALSGATFAQEATSDSWQRTAGASTRAAVNAEFAEARANGGMNSFSTGYNDKKSDGVLTRAQVGADLANSRGNGDFGRLNQEVHTYP